MDTGPCSSDACLLLPCQVGLGARLPQPNVSQNKSSWLALKLQTRGDPVRSACPCRRRHHLAWNKLACYLLVPTRPADPTSTPNHPRSRLQAQRPLGRGTRRLASSPRSRSRSRRQEREREEAFSYDLASLESASAVTPHSSRCAQVSTSRRPPQAALQVVSVHIICRMHGTSARSTDIVYVYMQSPASREHESSHVPRRHREEESGLSGLR